MKYLYHSTRLKELNILKPQPTLSDNIPIGDFVFATDNKILATMYLVNKGLDVLMNTASKKPRILIQSSKAAYEKNDAGGAIYYVAAEGFEDTPQNGLSEMEKVSRSPVLPLKKEVYESSLEAMKKAGIEIYFVNKSTFEKIIKNKNEDEVVQKLKRDS